MKWASVMVQGTDLRGLVENARADLAASLGTRSADLVMVFFSPDFRDQGDRLLSLLQEYWPQSPLAGCSAMGMVGPGKELEQMPGLVMMVGHLPGVEVSVARVDLDRLPDEDAPQEAWKQAVGLPGWDKAEIVVLADPFTGVIESFISGLDFAWPSGTKVGGLASGGGQAGENLLVAGDTVSRSGAVVVGMRGNIAIDAIVAQGCRPIGDPLTVTCCERNLILELDGKTPVNYLQGLLPFLSEYDRTLLTSSLFIGLQMDPFDAAPGQGDYLVRNLVGVDHEAGVMAIGAPVHEGQVVQFHLRDKKTSAEDLEQCLREYLGSGPVRSAEGALMFSCIGRGEYLYGTPSHDVGRFEAELGPIPVAGFFCNGEIGPVSGATYVHGYTTSFGIFRPAAEA